MQKKNKILIRVQKYYQKYMFASGGGMGWSILYCKAKKL